MLQHQSRHSFCFEIVCDSPKQSCIQSETYLIVTCSLGSYKEQWTFNWIIVATFLFYQNLFYCKCGCMLWVNVFLEGDPLKALTASNSCNMGFTFIHIPINLSNFPVPEEKKKSCKILLSVCFDKEVETQCTMEVLFFIFILYFYFIVLDLFRGIRMKGNDYKCTPYYLSFLKHNFPSTSQLVINVYIFGCDV